MNKDIEIQKPVHEHKGKSSENFIDKNRIINFLNISNGTTIVDAGCGNGYMSLIFEELVGDSGKVYAIDPDKNAIENLQSNISSEILILMEGDITKKNNLEASSIDLVYISNVIHGFSELEMAGFENEIKRLLKPHGILAIVEFKKEESKFGPPLNIKLSPEELKKKINMAAWKTLDIGNYSYMQLFEN